MATQSPLAKRIMEVMAVKKITVKELAQKANLKQATIYEWLRSETMPGSRLLTELSASLEITTDYLLGNKDYIGMNLRTIVSQESLAIYSRRSAMRPELERNALLLNITYLKTAPVTVEEWAELDQQLIPMVSDYTGTRKRTHKKHVSSPTLTVVSTKRKT